MEAPQRRFHYVKHGLAREWYPSGKLKVKGAFVHGQRDGIAEVWFEDGSRGTMSCGLRLTSRLFIRKNRRAMAMGRFAEPCQVETLPSVTSSFASSRSD
jgi:hypothetical protein